MDINKLIAKLPTGFVDEASGMDGEQLRAEIIRAETALREVDQFQKEDEKLTGAKEIVKDLVSGYNDVKRAQRAKIQYVLHVLEERGELGTGEFATEEMQTREVKAKPAKVGPGAKKRAAA